MKKPDTQISVFMGTEHGVENYILTDEVEQDGHHIQVYMPKPSPGETIEDVKHRLDDQIDFLISEGMLKSLLTQKLITDNEYKECLKDIKCIYLSENF
ncbi:MAG: hypothetical protein NHB14_19685 [Desulfosporosinus sp.]|nr:hypothetical protein [Desulfosporosinus sp.]